MDTVSPQKMPIVTVRRATTLALMGLPLVLVRSLAVHGQTAAGEAPSMEACLFGFKKKPKRFEINAGKQPKSPPTKNDNDGDLFPWEVRKKGLRIDELFGEMPKDKTSQLPPPRPEPSSRKRPKLPTSAPCSAPTSMMPPPGTSPPKRTSPRSRVTPQRQAQSEVCPTPNSVPARPAMHIVVPIPSVDSIVARIRNAGKTDKAGANSNGAEQPPRSGGNSQAAPSPAYGMQNWLQYYGLHQQQPQAALQQHNVLMPLQADPNFAQAYQQLLVAIQQYGRCYLQQPHQF